ncbi:hypothetical protein EH183_43105 [Streptomyces sp. CB01881]|uniref:protease inhibitor I42 family protein n=1 Tax=Streptomyces sp. CB01881 TaxID=2078691 RepID=UPI0011DF6D9D|nr:protease inhibitor I42 family protein [Streptomyces sp. CB01881]TYC66321.1 hypothetical protein EH183_43105 [Streptomyces sp. CB01881]
MRRIIIINVVALLVVALLLVSYLDGWWSDSGPAGTTAATATRPQVEVPLPDGDDTVSPYPPSTVTLAVGQQLGVRTTGGARPKRWYLDSAGDSSVLRPGRDFVITPCPTDPPAAGCGDEFDLTFTALAPGTTTLTWLFGEGGCKAGVPKFEWERCDISKSIQVTVH